MAAYKQIRWMIGLSYSLLLLLTLVQIVTYYLYNGRFHPFALIVMPEQGSEHSAEHDDRNNESTIQSEVQQSEEMSDSLSDIVNNYESDSDEYYSVEDFDFSTKDDFAVHTES